MEVSDYKKLSDIDHVLLRPSMYIGTTDVQAVQVWTVNPQTLKAEKKTVSYPFALEQLELEGATNCYDNVPRSRKKGIDPGRIEHTVTNRVITHYNEGVGIPVEMHPEEKLYVPHLIFFVLKTSSNYDDAKERTWAGTNGLGVKLVGIFSKWVEIEVADPERKLLYKQRAENNLKQIHEPIITPYNGKVSYTKLSYEADFERFGVSEYSDDLIKVFAFSAASASFTTGVPVIFNGVKFDFTSIETYSRLFVNGDDCSLVYKDGTTELCLIDAPEKGFNVSFVNGMYTRKGGAHVNETLKIFSQGSLDKLNKKKKIFDVRDVKKHLALIIKCTVVNPVFTTQAKEEFSKPVPKIDIPESIIKKVEKWNFVKQLSLYANIKLNGNEKEKTKKDKHVIIKDAEDANDAGGPNSLECVAMITEGLSAKTFALRYRALFKNGADKFGVIPIRGKFLNIRNATPYQLAENEELKSIRDLLGIKPGIDYTIEENRKTLRYGKVRFATDADVDGFHIQGLLINLFGYSYDSLMKINFIEGLMTALISVQEGNKMHYFYTQAEFDDYWNSLTDKEKKKLKDHVTHFKGLGRWEKQHFKNVDKFKVITYLCDEKANDSLKLAFDKSMADTRKEWVSNVSPAPPTYLQGPSGEIIQTITDYVDTKLRLYSNASNERALASAIDSFVPARRKVFYAMRKNNLKDKPIKIAQFQGYVALNTAYEHGEDNIGDVIMNMCQDFPGANNIPLVTGHGEYGSRVEGGKDHADARYVFMSNGALNNYLFRQEDDRLLKAMVVDGIEVEPEFYIPILPVICFNGSNGIGTGFSNESPCYNPKDIVTWVRTWIVNNHPKEDETEMDYPTLLPWYRNFKGTITEEYSGKYVTEGVFTFKQLKNGNEIHISELPINKWISNYSEFVDQLLVNKKISDKKKGVHPDIVDFTLYDYLEYPTAKNLKLTSSLSTHNIVLYDEEGRICKFNNIESVIDNFCTYRYNAYHRRREMQLKDLEEELKREEVKVRFLRDVVEKKLDVVNDPEIEVKMEERGYPLEFLTMAIRSITKKGLEKHEKDCQDIRDKIKLLSNMTPRDIWESDISDFEKAYNKVYNNLKIVK